MAPIKRSANNVPTEFQMPSAEDYLREALERTKEQLKQEEAENAALKEQMTSWKEEKERILKALKKERTARKEVQKGSKVQSKDDNEELSAKCRSLQEDLERKEKEVLEREAMWHHQLTALEDQLTNETAEKVETFIHVEELKHNIELLTKNNPGLQDQVLRTPSRILKDFEDQIAELASENAALKEQTAPKESSWEEEKNKILIALRKERAIRKQAQTDLKTTVKDYQDQITKLASENAALKEQTAPKESSWEEEKEKILTALRSERVLHKQAQTDLKSKVKEYQDSQDQIDCLTSDLLAKENELRLAEQFWAGERDRVTAFGKDKAAKITETWEKEFNYILAQKNLLAKTLQEEKDRKETQLQEKEVQLVQREAEFKTELAALDDRMRSQLASKDETIEELQRNLSYVEQQWSDQMNLVKDQIPSLTDTIATLQARISNLEERSQERMTEELKAQEEKFKKIIEEKEVQLIQSEEEWKTRHTGLEILMRTQLASHEEITNKLQSNTTELKQQWSNQLNLLEDGIQVRDKAITTLQERISNLEETSPENMTSEELKAQKKIIKRLIKEKEAEEKRQKKERKVKERKRWWF